MKIVRTQRAVDNNGVVLQPRTRYVLHDHTANEISNDVISCSAWDSYNKQYTGQDLTNKTLCIYRLYSYGDQLMMTALARSIKQKYPQGRILYCAMEDVSDVWAYNTDIEFLRAPLTFELAQECDYHLFLEQTIESNTEPDQPSCYDIFYSIAGMEAPADCKPHVVIDEKDRMALQRWRLHPERPNKYITINWNASRDVRTYPPSRWLEFISMFLDEFPQYSVVVYGLTKSPPKIEGERVVNLVNRTKNFRDLIPLLMDADANIGSDSGAMHLAAGLELPFISLWGPFHPKDRISTYENNTPLMGECEPCKCNSDKLPRALCKQNKNYAKGTKYCQSLANIDPLRIIEKLKKVLVPLPISETSKCRHRLAKYCVGIGVDIGCGGDPITDTAITVDHPNQYVRCGDKPIQAKLDIADIHTNFRSLDYIYTSHLLEDFSYDRVSYLLAKLRASLKEGGVLVTYCPDQKLYEEYCRSNGEGVNPHHKEKDFSLSTFKKCFEWDGWSIVHETAHVEDYSFELVTRKV